MISTTTLTKLAAIATDPVSNALATIHCQPSTSLPLVQPLAVAPTMTAMTIPVGERIECRGTGGRSNAGVSVHLSRVSPSVAISLSPAGRTERPGFPPTQPPGIDSIDPGIGPT